MQNRNTETQVRKQLESTLLECNYADNYYGDQVCVLKKL